MDGEWLGIKVFAYPHEVQERGDLIEPSGRPFGRTEWLAKRERTAMKKGTVSIFGTIAAISGVLAASGTLSSCCGAGTAMRGAGCMGMSNIERSRAPAPEPSTGAAGVKVGEEAVCPVDGMKVRVTADTPSAEYRGQRYYFCNEAEKTAFQAQPDRYGAR